MLMLPVRCASVCGDPAAHSRHRRRLWEAPGERPSRAAVFRAARAFTACPSHAAAARAEPDSPTSFCIWPCMPDCACACVSAMQGPASWRRPVQCEQGWRGRRRGRARTLGVGRCQDDQLVILRHGLPVVHGADLEAHLRLPLVLQHGRHADVRVQLRARRPALARLLALAGHGRAICGPTSPILAGRGRASRGPTLGQLTLLPHSCKCISQSMRVRRGLWTGFVARRRHSPP